MAEVDGKAPGTEQGSLLSPGFGVAQNSFFSREHSVWTDLFTSSFRNTGIDDGFFILSYF